jgi:hypothetical protein
MKKLFYICLAVIAVLMIACQSSELPPEPGKPGTGQAAAGIKTGAAIQYVPEGYAPPQDVFDNDKQIFFLKDYIINLGENENTVSLSPSVNHAGSYVYKYGYYYSPQQQKWIEFEYPQKTVSGSNWIKETANTYLSISAGNLVAGENYVISYSCKKHDGQWKCGCRDKYICGYWMLNTFVYRMLDLPPEPVPPGSPILMRAYIWPSNQIVEQSKQITVGLGIDTSWDISDGMPSTVNLLVKSPNGTKENIQLNRQEDVYCSTTSKEGRFGCYVSFSGEYTPKLAGEYLLEMGELGEPPEFVRISNGNFKAFSAEYIDNILIRKNIGEYIFQSNNYIGWYSEWYGEVFDAYYSKDMSGASVQVYTGKNSEQDFNNWLIYNQDRIVQQKIDVDNVTYTLNGIPYEYTEENGNNQASVEIKWMSNGKLISIYGWIYNSDFEDLIKWVGVAYLRRYPVTNETIYGAICKTDADCPPILCALYCVEGVCSPCPVDRCINNACTMCKPECKNVNSPSEGWYDSCTGGLIRYANCNYNCTDEEYGGVDCGSYISLCSNKLDHVAAAGIDRNSVESIDIIEQSCYNWDMQNPWGNGDKQVSCPRSSNYDVCMKNANDGNGNYVYLGVKYKEDHPGNCTDSDANTQYPDGKNYLVKGSVVINGLAYTDSCYNCQACLVGAPCEEKCKTLIENYCTSYGQLDAMKYDCPNGCSDGACINKTSFVCTDSDGGLNYYVKSIIGTKYWNGTETCSGDFVNENYCNNNSNLIQAPYLCPNGCSDGACIP